MLQRWWSSTVASLLGLGACSADLRGEEPRDIPEFLPTPSEPLTRPPARPQPTPPPTPPRPGRAEYDPAYNYLPERNPGVRQPPCPCLPLGRTWVHADYFLGTTRSDTVPPLVVAGPNALIVGGDRGLTHRFRSGLRLDFGTWLDQCQNLGIEGRFFTLERGTVEQLNASGGETALGRPFALAGVGNQADPIAGPGLGSGGVQILAPLNYLSGGVGLRQNLFCEDQVRLDVVYGYQFLRLDETLRITSSQQTALGGRQVLDQFHTGNVFHGGQVGLSGELRRDRWFVDATGLLSVGAMRQELSIQGGSRLQAAAGAVTQLDRGLLTGPGNLGRTTQLRTCFVPEANLTVGYQLTDGIRATVGYQFVYLSNVSRPGQAIDPVVALGTPARPARVDATTDFWLQGISLGLEVRY